MLKLYHAKDEHDLEHMGFGLIDFKKNRELLRSIPIDTEDKIFHEKNDGFITLILEIN